MEKQFGISKLNSLFRVQTIIILKNHPEGISGYDIAKNLENITGEKPSSGKLYPFLHELKKYKYISEIEDAEKSNRIKVKYHLTEAGEELYLELIERMSNLIDARLEQILDVCHHCGVKLYHTEVFAIDKHGKKMLFCCKHCKAAYFNSIENKNHEH